MNKNLHPTCVAAVAANSSETVHTQRIAAPGSIRRALAVVIAAFVCVASQPAHSAPPEIYGTDLSYSHPNYRQKLAQIWDFVSTDLALGSSKMPAPDLHLEPFDRAEQSPAWTQWQNEWIVNNADVWLEWTEFPGKSRDEITPDWIRANLDKIYPFPKSFRGFHYDHSNKIQVNPDTTFLAFYQTGPYGDKMDMVGYGYYVSGHEMAHHAFMLKGVPETLHHCMYVVEVDGQPSLMKRLVNFLVDSSISGFVVERYGLQQEVALDPCSHLSKSDRNIAEKYARAFATANKRKQSKAQNQTPAQ